MKMHRILSVVAVLALLSSAPVALAENEGTRIAVANVTRIFDSLDERHAVQDEIRSDAQEAQAREQQYRGHIQNLRQQLQHLDPGSQDFMDVQEELNETMLQMQLWGEMEQQKLARREATETYRLYSKMMDAIATVAQDEGYDLVLFQDEQLQPVQNAQELRAQIQMRQVLYASDDIEISDHIIQRMNAEYQAGQ